MAMHFKDKDIQILARVFQARLSDGFLLLDRFGALLNRVQKEHPVWAARGIGVQQAHFRHSDLKLLSNVGTGAIDVTTEGKISLSDASATIQKFGEQVELWYGLVTKTVDLAPPTRIGFQCNFLAPTDSIEEADKLICVVLKSPVQEAVSKSTNMEVVDGHLNLFLEDSSTGLRRSIQIMSTVVEQPPGALEPQGFDVEGSGGVQIAIDNYFRPQDEHPNKLNLFIQEQFNQSIRIARELFAWIVSPKVNYGDVRSQRIEAPDG